MGRLRVWGVPLGPTVLPLHTLVACARLDNTAVHPLLAVQRARLGKLRHGGHPSVLTVPLARMPPVVPGFVHCVQRDHILTCRFSRVVLCAHLERLLH